MNEKDQQAFNELEEKISKLRVQSGVTEDDEKCRPSRPVWGDGIQAGAEMVAGVGLGALIGYSLDRWLETGPFLLIVFFFLGAAAGMLNAYRHLRRISKRGKEN